MQAVPGRRRVSGTPLLEFDESVKIINRYVLREHVGPLVFALSALTSLLLLNYIAKRFGQFVGKGLDWSVILEFVLLSIPFTIAMTIPMAVLVATLYAFSRLAAENEITAFKASGVSIRRLLTPVVIAASFLAVLMVGFNDQVLPAANYRLSILQNDIFRKKPTLALRERVTNRVTDNFWISASRITQGTGRMQDVVIYDFADPARPRTVYADSGTLAFTADERNLQLTLFGGAVQEFPPNDRTQLQRTRFERNDYVVRDVGNQLERSGGAQVKGDREMTVCEMQARYDSVAVEYDRQHDRLDSLAATMRAGGDTVTVPQRRATFTEYGLGALYCKLLDRIAPAEAHAAAVAQDSTPGAAAPRARPSFAPSTGGEAAALADLRLQTQIKRDFLNTYDVEIQKKFALAVACVVFVILGAPIALRFPRGGVGLVIGVSLGVFALYYIALIAGETVANKGYLPPFAAMWAANVLFGGVGLLLLLRLGREGATGRGGDLGEMIEAMRERFSRRRAAAATEAR